MADEKRSLAEFRAIRETVGMTQGMLAAELGVEPRSVRRWESPSYEGYRPPRDAWDALDAALDAQRRGIEAALGKVDEIAQERGAYPKSVMLPYWTSQEAYDEGHYVDEPHARGAAPRARHTGGLDGRAHGPAHGVGARKKTRIYGPEAGQAIGRWRMARAHCHTSDEKPAS